MNFLFAGQRTANILLVDVVGVEKSDDWFRQTIIDGSCHSVDSMWSLWTLA